MVSSTENETFRAGMTLLLESISLPSFCPEVTHETDIPRGAHRIPAANGY